VSLQVQTLKARIASLEAENKGLVDEKLKDNGTASKNIELFKQKAELK